MEQIVSDVLAVIMFVAMLIYLYAVVRCYRK